MSSTSEDSSRNDSTKVFSEVKEYYGKILKTKSDLKSNACVPLARPLPAHVRNALAQVHPDIVAKFYGCGLVVPECVEGCSVLDLGCGSGRDCYMLSQLVGEKGHITGIDMTRDQLDLAQKYVDYHMERYGYKKPNVNFVQGYIEDLLSAGLEENSYDIIISNCVINLSPDKARVLRQAFRVLKDGGEFYFSDVYSDGRISEDLKANKLLWGECLSGALWWKDLLQLAEDAGFTRPRLVTAHIINVGNQELEALLGDYCFVSATYRLFKLPNHSRKDSCMVMYNGSITGAEQNFEFDAQYTFKADDVMEVDADVTSILSSSRFSDEFTFQSQRVNRSGCSYSKPKKVSINPFEATEQLGSSSVCSSAGGCCSEQESASCCPSPRDC